MIAFKTALDGCMQAFLFPIPRQSSSSSPAVPAALMAVWGSSKTVDS